MWTSDSTLMEVLSDLCRANMIFYPSSSDARTCVGMHCSVVLVPSLFIWGITLLQSLISDFHLCPVFRSKVTFQNKDASGITLRDDAALRCQLRTVESSAASRLSHANLVAFVIQSLQSCMPCCSKGSLGCVDSGEPCAEDDH